MEQDPGGSRPPPEGSEARQPQQSVTASGGFSVRQVVQLAVEGNYESHIVLNYNRSDLEELDEYLKRAKAAYETGAAFQEADLGSWTKEGQKFSDPVLTIIEAGQTVSPVILRGGSWKNVRSPAFDRLAPSVFHFWKDSSLG